jgi:hypothetical protein
MTLDTERLWIARAALLVVVALFVAALWPYIVG